MYATALHTLSLLLSQLIASAVHIFVHIRYPAIFIGKPMLYIKPNRTFTNIFYAICFMLKDCFRKSWDLHSIHCGILSKHFFDIYFLFYFQKENQRPYSIQARVPFSLSLHILYSYTLKIWMTTMTKDSFFFHFFLLLPNWVDTFVLFMTLNSVVH